jgi:hypothetical protein
MKPLKPTPKTKAHTLRHHTLPTSRHGARESQGKPAKKARNTMTQAQEQEAKNAAATQRTVDPRGAGSGERAVATRARNYNESPAEFEAGSKYPKGDPAKGRIDPVALTEGQTAEQIPMRDRRAYLLDQAEKNEAANDELNAIQTDQNKRLQLAQNLIQDPDVMREESMETAKNALMAHDPETHKQIAEHRHKLAQQHVLRGQDRNQNTDVGQAAADKRTERVEARQTTRLGEGKNT